VLVAYPEVVPPINVPLDIVSISFGGKGMVPMRLCDFLPLRISRLLMRFVVPVIRIELECCEQMSIVRGGYSHQVCKLPNLMSGNLLAPDVGSFEDLLLVYGLYLHVMKAGVMELITYTLKWMLQFVLQAGKVRPAILWSRSRHGELEYQLKVVM
jgi:hypothetical protein